MRKFSLRFVPKVLIVVVLAFAGINAIAQQDDDDADLPPFAKDKISKEAYMNARQAYINMLRGTEGDLLPINPRLRALEAKAKMEKDQSRNGLMLLGAPNWVQLGPSPIPNGQTSSFAASVSGRVTAIAVHPTNLNIVYVGLANGGVYRTMDGGSTWTAIADQMQSMAVGALALAPSNPTILYVGTGEANLSADSYAGIGVYRIDNADSEPSLVGPINPPMNFTSTSGGSINTTAFGYRSISKILVHPTNPAIIFVATSTGTSSNPSSTPFSSVPPLGIRGVYRSTNATAAANSITFTKLVVSTSSSLDLPNTGNTSITDLVFEPGNPNNLLAWSYESTPNCGVYKSVNALDPTPTFVRKYNSTASSVRGEFAIAKIGDDVVAYACTGEGNGKVIRTIDGGENWVTPGGGATFCNPQCFYDLSIAMHPNNAALVYLGGSAGSRILQISSDSAKAFISSVSGLHADNHVLVVAPSNPNVIYVGTDGGICRSINGGASWTSLNNVGFHATQFQSIALHPIDPKFTIGGTQDNGTNMMKPDGTFNRIDFGDGGYAAIDQNATDNTNVVMYHTYFNSTTLAGYARVDNIASAVDGWPFFGCGGTANGIPCPTNVLFYAPVVLGPGNPNTVYYGSDVLYRSADKGISNTAVSQTFGSAIVSISISPSDDNYRIISLRDGSVYASIDGGLTLTNITPADAPSKPATRVLIAPGNKNIAFVSYGGYGVSPANKHIYRTTNLNALGGAGVTWTAVGNGLPDIPVNCLAMGKTNLNIVFAGCDIGVYASVDGGLNWTSFSAGLPAVPIFDMAVHPITRNLRIATHGRGFWESTENPLPISLTSFTATAKTSGKVLLQWFTSSETNNRGFDIERSIDKQGQPSKWEKIGFVTGNGTTNSPRRYEYTDAPIGGKRFIYRLRQMDFNNTAKLSEERLIELRAFDFALFPVYPNPVTTKGTIRYQVPLDGVVTMALYSSNGALVKKLVSEKKEAGIYSIDINTQALAPGQYYIALKMGEYSDTKPLVVNR